MLSKGRTGTGTRTGSDRSHQGEAQQDTMLRDRLLDMPTAAVAKTGRRITEEPAAAATRKRTGRAPDGDQQQAVTGRRCVRLC